MQDKPSIEKTASAAIGEKQQTPLAATSPAPTQSAAASPAAAAIAPYSPMTEGGDMVVCHKCGVSVNRSDAIWTNRSICNQKLTVKEIHRCRPCNSMGMILHRVFQKDQSIQLQYKKMNAGQQQEWLMQHKKEFGELTTGSVYKSLSDFMTKTSFQSSKVVAESAFTTEHDWLPEKDLFERFKDDVEAAENIKKFGKSFECPDTKRLLYGVPHYSSKGKEGSSSSFEHELQAQTSVGPPKKQQRITESSLRCVSARLLWESCGGSPRIAGNCGGSPHHGG
jgi:hypothetical protein